MHFFIFLLHKVVVLFYFNKTKYFRLCLTDEVSSERPKGDLRLTWDWPETDLRLTWDWTETELRLTWDWPETDLGPETDLRLTWDWPRTELGLTWDWPEWERWRLKALDKFGPNRRTQIVTSWAPYGAKNRHLSKLQHTPPSLSHIWRYSREPQSNSWLWLNAHNFHYNGPKKFHRIIGHGYKRTFYQMEHIW